MIGIDGFDVDDAKAIYDDGAVLGHVELSTTRDDSG